MVIAAFFKLIRWPNLVMIILIQYLIRFAIIESLEVPHVLNHLEFFLGVLCSISLAAAGYIINDLYDIQTDLENKPKRVTIGKEINSGTAWIIYGLFNLIAVVSAYILAHAAGLQSLWLIAPIAMVLLYLYAVDLKKRAVIGNMLVSILVALPVVLVGVFDVLPAAGSDNDPLVKSAFQVITAYSAFAFFLNLIREIVKDTEDVIGDRNAGYRTLSVIMGRDQVKYVVLLLLFILLIFTGAYNLYLFENNTNLLSSLYLLILVNLPILGIAWFVLNARSTADFKRVGMFLKVLMLTGMLSMLVFTLAIKSVV